jgi:hypothetical protein
VVIWLAKRKAAKKRVARRGQKRAAPKLTAKQAPGMLSGMDFAAVFDLWKVALTKPDAAISGQTGKASYVKGILMLCLAGALYAVISAVLTTNFFALVLGPVMFAVAVPIMVLVGAAIVFAFAKILGGKGGLREQFYLSAVLLSPILLLMACAKVLYIIPLIGFVFKAVAVFVLEVYALYQVTLALRSVHDFSTMRAILSWLLPLFIVTLVVVIFALIVVAAILAFVPAAVLVGLLS